MEKEDYIGLLGLGSPSPFTLGTTSNRICLGGEVKAGMAFWGVILWWQKALEGAVTIYWHRYQ